MYDLWIYVAVVNNGNNNKISFKGFFNIINHQNKLERWKQLYVLNIHWGIHPLLPELSFKGDLISKLFKEQYIKLMTRKA